MTEVELRLQVPAHALAAVQRLVAGEGSTRLRLQAAYFDTADGELAAAGLALRLRKEGRRWVQTLKAGSPHGLAREEHEQTVAPGPAGAEPALDAARHRGTPAGDALQALLASAGDAQLQARYRTDIQRRRCVARARRGRIELALDCGRISAPRADGGALHWPVCELEVELASGSPLAVTETARRLAARHGLWLEARSKAERGTRLAQGLAPDAVVPAVKARPLALARGMDAATAWRAVLDNVLAQALPNWSELAADGPATRNEESLHQLRVALRRLRSAQRLFEGWPGVESQALGEPAAALFRALGAGRDRAVLASGLQREIDAALLAQGALALALPAGGAPAAWTGSERAAHGLLFIDLLGATVAPAVPPPATEDGEPLALRFARRLARWHRQVRRDAKRFDSLDDAARHRLRKRLKRLRYAIEFGAALFPARSLRRYLRRLTAAQEQLGRFNDVCVAQAAYAALLPAEPRAWFALGWLQAQRAAVLADCVQALGPLRRAKPFWPELKG